VTWITSGVALYPGLPVGRAADVLPGYEPRKDPRDGREHRKHYLNEVFVHLPETRDAFPHSPHKPKSIRSTNCGSGGKACTVVQLLVLSFEYVPTYEVSRAIE
jgi:hypothetical protein